MRKKEFKNLCIISILVMVTVVTSCGLYESQSKTSLVSKTETEKTIVKVWTVYSPDNQDSRTQAFITALDKANKDLKDIKIQNEFINTDTYKIKLKTAMAANELPDVFFSWGAGFLKPFVESGKVLSLDPYLDDATLNRMKPENTVNFAFNNKIYGLTAYPYVAILFCNKELFEKNNIKLPDTYEDLVTAVKAFRAKNIIPISIGERDLWPGSFWQNAFALRTAGSAASLNALAKSSSFNQPDFVKSAALLQELVNLRAFNDQVLKLSEEEGQAIFLHGDAAMYFTGSWIADNLDSKNSAVAGKVVAMKFPELSGGNYNTNEFIGGAIDGFCVSSNTKIREASVKVCKSLAEGTANAYGGITTWKTASDSVSIMTPLKQQIFDIQRSAKGYVLAWDTLLTGSDAETHKNLVARIFSGTISPERFAIEMQRLNENK